MGLAAIAIYLIKGEVILDWIWFVFFLENIATKRNISKLLTLNEWVNLWFLDVLVTYFQFQSQNIEKNFIVGIEGSGDWNWQFGILNVMKSKSVMTFPQSEYCNNIFFIKFQELWTQNILSNGRVGFYWPNIS